MRAFSFLAVIFLAPLAALAQSTEPMKTRALSFNINGLTLSGLNGGLGGKIWIPGNRALVASIDGSYTGNFSEASDSLRVDSRSRSWDVTANVGLEQHFSLQPDLSPYLLGGLFLGHGGSWYREGFLSDPNVDANRNFSVGGKGGFGLEYWLTPRFSVSGQQLVVLSYTWGYYNPSGSFDRENNRLSLDLGTSTVILSVYF